MIRGKKQKGRKAHPRAPYPARKGKKKSADYEKKKKGTLT